ncbi:Citrate synthase 2 [Polystyrenella longa]|uniref:Citrate synthase n=1 Tax=Polystyrenella longa TaxID=2528007 RepID=A0A518CH05_9PLAN|nr:citrate synthase [Polystyrenella longa]QDU78508.1 Citrate synthase 2 [Polystyrenella longa]
MSDGKEPKPDVSKGLKGVKAADSSVCYISGEEGKLLYRGYNIDDLAENTNFEEVAYLLFKGELPNKEELKEFSELMATYQSLPPQLKEFVKSLPQDVIPMTALRSAISIAGVYDSEAEDESTEANFRKAIRLTSLMATLVAAIRRHRDGKEILDPKPGLSFAANTMYMLNGVDPTDDEIKAMDLVLILHAEHGFNASTFTARVISATLSDIYSAITGAIGALKGKLHGGANIEVIKTLHEIGSADKVEAWVKEVKANKGKFMGFGHAVYQVEDPRAKHMKELSKRLGNEKGEPVWYDISEKMEATIKPLINKNCNVDFYSASLQYYMGIPKELFTCIFAASRIAGWCAHVLEQYADNKIIRPSSNYTGPDERTVKPIGDR